MGIEKEVLDYFASKCPADECIVEILDFWLRNHKEQVTWKDVARALKAINLQQLTLDIESIYTTGNYIKCSIKKGACSDSYIINNNYCKLVSLGVKWWCHRNTHTQECKNWTFP